MTSTTGAAARARDDARRYLTDGRRVVPLRFKTPWDAIQGCARQDWPSLTVTADDVERDFTGAVTGVGIVLGASSDNAVDLDYSEAIAAEDRCLAATGSMFGCPNPPPADREVGALLADERA